jgi:transposase InsO family protein
MQNPTAMETHLQFEKLWLSRYPQPLQYIHEQGNEFTCKDFQRTLQRAGIDNVPITVQNPQANAICKCMLQMVARPLRIVTNANPPY